MKVRIIEVSPIGTGAFAIVTILNSGINEVEPGRQRELTSGPPPNSTAQDSFAGYEFCNRAGIAATGCALPPTVRDLPMFTPILAHWATRYGNFYLRYATEWWDNMTPMQYGTILISVAVFGWVLMKSQR